MTTQSRVRDLYAHPVGRDIIRKILLQTGHSDTLVTNPLVGGLKLSALPKLTGGLLDAETLDTLIRLVNSEPDVPQENGAPVKPAWWKEAVFYQIYPRSFCDGNADGIGDLRGIIGKLDYIRELGADAVWLSPIYDSPCDDNGYDIRDYTKILGAFGTMEDFDELLHGLHERGMRLIMDLVVNHTSDEHAWFQTALREPDSLYRAYYLFREFPNNWTSYFGGSAWNHYPEQDLYALHLFSKKQMDLNWENPALRREIAEMVRWWLQKGVDGFRLDVINYISKSEGLPEGSESIGKLMGYRGVEHYFYGPRLHEYLRELKQEAFTPFHAFSVGETPGVGMEMSKLLTADNRQELDMVFSFDHLESPGHARFDDYRYDLCYLKDYMTDWMEHYGNRTWMSLFYNNHDNPRMISKIDPDPAVRFTLAKLLAVIQFTLRGTPFVYQGDELGMINRDFASADELRDVESLNMYTDLCRTMTPGDALRKVLAGSRDHARTPMQWTGDQNAGFSKKEPWISPGDDCKICNVRDQLADPDSVLHFYRELIALRKAHRALVYGDIEIRKTKDRELFLYTRSGADGTFFIECNLSKTAKSRRDGVPAGKRVLSNYTDISDDLRPYEASVWRCK